MIKKKIVFKWGRGENESFNLIKQEMINSPSLASPIFSNHFILYTFTSETSYVAILT